MNADMEIDGIPGDEGEIPDDEVDSIYESAAGSVVNAVSFLDAVNPYPAGSRRAEVWALAYRNAYAREMGR